MLPNKKSKFINLGFPAVLKVLSYNSIDTIPNIIKATEVLSLLVMAYENAFFSGACFQCGVLAFEPEVRLQRCAGCQLVSYCTKSCQQSSWKQHKILCKRFPVKNGKNVIVRETESVGFLDAMNKLQDQLDGLMIQRLIEIDPFGGPQIKNPNQVLERLKKGIREYKHFFLKARVCNVCHEARPEMLYDCRCCAISYCSSAHRMQDDCHLTQQCDYLYKCALANWYLTNDRLLIPDGLLNEANINDGLKFEHVHKLAKYSKEKWLDTIVNIINERLTFPLTIHHALKNLKFGEQGEALSEITSLTIHIVHKTPMLDPRIWEFFLHQLPNLKKINLTFINEKMRLYNAYNSCISEENSSDCKCCSDCMEKERVITYNIHHMHYDEYFSSDEYMQPDVVAVFGSKDELVSVDKAHNLTCQRNMTYNKHTLVILTDTLKNDLEGCVNIFHEARPVKFLLPVQENPACLFSIHNNTTSFYYVCCIQGIH